jgi:hypothetical protein
MLASRSGNSRAWILCLLCLLLLLGCSSPMSRYSGNDPAMAYVPIAFAGVADARPSFRTMFCEALARTPGDTDEPCDYWLRRLVDEGDTTAAAAKPAASLFQPGSRQFDLLIVSGIFAECLPQVPAFADATAHLRSLGYSVDYVPVKGRASPELNADILGATIDSLRASGRKRKFIVLAYSKGAVDTITALERHPGLAADIAAVISFAGAVNGSPLADQYLELYKSLVATTPYEACAVTDGGELAGLTRERRLAWLATRHLPAGPAFFSIVATPAKGRVSSALIPMHTALSRIDPRNDGQVLHFDALLPGATLLAYVNADHFAIALPFLQRMPGLASTLINKNDFPRTALATAAVLYVEAALPLQMKADTTTVSSTASGIERQK